MMAFRMNKILEERVCFSLGVGGADVLKRLQSSLQFMCQICFLEAVPGLFFEKGELQLGV